MPVFSSDNYRNICYLSRSASLQSIVTTSPGIISGIPGGHGSNRTLRTLPTVIITGQSPHFPRSTPARRSRRSVSMDGRRGRPLNENRPWRIRLQHRLYRLKIDICRAASEQQYTAVFVRISRIITLYAEFFSISHSKAGRTASQSNVTFI